MEQGAGVKSLRLPILALPGALAILLGLMVPAVAVPCADGEGAPMSCVLPEARSAIGSLTLVNVMDGVSHP